MSELLMNSNINIERIIAKIDNDFNPDNSDWIPRVGTWAIDAMQQLNVLPTERRRIKLLVKDRIAYFECNIVTNNIKVYDSNGCEVKEASSSQTCNGCPSTGESASETSGSTIATDITSTVSVITNNSANNAPDYLLAETINEKSWPGRYNIHEYSYENNNSKDRNYVIVDCNKIELNFDTDYICVETNHIKTIYSETFGCEVPVIPNNGLLIEAITYYCMYKMLCRGYKHPVFNLQASQYGTNPYYIWISTKEEAKRSVIANNVKDDTSKLFRSNFYINTLDPRN